MFECNAVICPGHPRRKSNPKYRKWAELLFADGTWPGPTPRLQQEVLFWIKAWETGSVGIWTEFGPTPLTLLEYLLIGTASTLFPSTLLNCEGVNR